MLASCILVELLRSCLGLVSVPLDFKDLKPQRLSLEIQVVESFLFQ